MKLILLPTFAALLTLGVIQMGSAQATDEAFLKFDPAVEGESKVIHHLNEIELVGFRSNLTRAGLPGITVPSGKPKFGPLKVYKYIDKASVPLMVACAAGTKYKTATVTVFSTPQIGVPYDSMKIVLSDVFVSGVDGGNEATDGEGNLLETVMLSYSKIEWSYVPLDSRGAPLPTIKGGWDLTKGVKL